MAYANQQLRQVYISIEKHVYNFIHMKKLFFPFILFLSVLSPIFSQSPIDVLVDDLRESIEREKTYYRENVQSVSREERSSINNEQSQWQETFSNHLSNDRDGAVYEKVKMILSDLPEPLDNTEPNVHYRALIEGIIDHNIISPIATATHTSLMPLNNVGNPLFESTGHNLILTETITFLEKLVEIKGKFVNETITLILSYN